MLTLLIIALVLCFISGSPLFSIMLAGTALGAFFSSRGFDIQFNGAINKIFSTSDRDEIEVLSTIPLFIYSGYVLAEAKTADRLVRFANAAMGWLPGGLAIVTILTCALFTVFTGASGVTIIALGGVLMPALVKNGYPKKFSMGLIAGTGSVGLLFPPALPLFIYGTVYGLTGIDKDWDTRRFLFAGVVPGMTLVAMLSAVAIFVAVKKKLPRQKFELNELGRSFLKALPELMIPFGVIILLGTGFALSDVAALTLFYVAVLEIGVYKMIKPKQLLAISHEALAMIGAIFMIILASTAFTDFMVNAEVPTKLVAWTSEHVESKIVFLLAINVILLIVGTVMDIFSAIVVVLPLIAPIAHHYNINPYHLGVIFLLNLEVGYLHPPVGLNLFLTSVKFNRPITEVMWATIPFLITMIVALLTITYVPALTVVPEAERTAPVNNLVLLVESGLEEIKVAYPKITLIDDQGGALKDEKGKPIEHAFVDCAKLTEETARGACQQVHFDATNCKPDPKSTDPKQVACYNKAVAGWVVSNLNGDALHPEYAVIVMKDIALVDADGAAIKVEDKEVLGPDGKPIVKHLAACDKMTGTDKENCRAVFSEASNCYIAAPDFQECADACGAAPAEAPAGGSGSDAGSGSATGSGSAAPAPAGDCKATCRADAVKKCVADAVSSWIDDDNTRAKPD